MTMRCSYSRNTLRSPSSPDVLALPLRCLRLCPFTAHHTAPPADTRPFAGSCAMPMRYWRRAHTRRLHCRTGSLGNIVRTRADRRAAPFAGVVRGSVEQLVGRTVVVAGVLNGLRCNIPPPPPPRVGGLPPHHHPFPRLLPRRCPWDAYGAFYRAPPHASRHHEPHPIRRTYTPPP